MRVLLVLLTVLLVVPGVADARRGKRVIAVYDHTPTHLDWYVEETVADFNAVLPKGTRLRYVDMQGAPCPAEPRKGITVCEGDTGPHTGEVTRPRPRALVRVRHGFVPQPKGSGSNLICHELMHALTGVGDNPMALPQDSCVWGTLPQPGPFDVDLLRKAYKRKHR